MTSQSANRDTLSQWLGGAGKATLDALTAEAPDVIAVVDPNLVIRYLNYTGPGFTKDSVTGASVLSITPLEYQKTAAAAFGKVLGSGERTQYEVLFKDEKALHAWEVRLGPIRDKGEVIGVLALSTEVSAARKARADRDRFFLLSLDMLAVANHEGRFTRLNPAFSEALGYSLSEIEGRIFLEFVHPDDLAGTLDIYNAMVSGAPVTDFENRYRCKDGSYRVFSWRATVDPVTGDAYAVARDVTELRSTEQQLRHAQKMEAIGQLAGGVAHDFNNLMMAVLANAELAQEEESFASAAEHLKEIQEAGERAAGLTRQLLSFSRQRTLRPVAVDLNQLVSGLMKLLRRLLPENIAFHLVCGRDLASVHADPTQLEQVIVNLCVNARDAMLSGGRLTIETQNVSLDDRYGKSHPWVLPGNYVLLRVSDTGMGMMPDEKERAFEPFFSTKPAHEGTGLGLSTVYGIVRQHAGMVQLQSEPGKGATFEIHLPATVGPAKHQAESAEPMPQRGRETLLLAEDEAQVRRAVTQILRRAGYRVLTAKNGKEAVALARISPDPVRLALLDVVMPELGGPETWQQLRALHPSMCVLFASGYADERYLKGLPPDAEVLEKPFRTAQLLSAIRRKLDT